MSGLLTVRRDGDWLTLNFPTSALELIETPALIYEALQIKPLQTFRTTQDLLVIVSAKKK